jgi:hypothetical protein
MNWNEGIWHRAKRAVEMNDLAMARALGFDACQQCGRWFQLAGQEWRDCTGCGRHCQECAESVAWHWCADCGHYACQRCSGDGPSTYCPVCQIASAGE